MSWVTTARLVLKRALMKSVFRAGYLLCLSVGFMLGVYCEGQIFSNPGIVSTRDSSKEAVTHSEFTVVTGGAFGLYLG